MVFVPAPLANNNDIVNARYFGAVGDGVVDDRAALQAAIDYCFGPAIAPNGGLNYRLNKSLYIPQGLFKISAPLLLTGVMGAQIIGAGRGPTIIESTSTGATNGCVFITNACQYSRIEGMGLLAGTDGTCFRLNYDGEGTWSVALQSNTFHDMSFNGGDYGVEIAGAGFMGSENLFLNCFFQSHVNAGLVTWAANALQQSVIGGNFQGCGIAIRVSNGSVPVIHGVGFQTSTTRDISIEGSAYDGYTIHGCRSESDNFVTLGGCHGSISSCGQTSGTNGIFADFTETAGTIANCVSKAGKIVAGDESRVAIQRCDFERADWLDVSGGLSAVFGQVEIDSVRQGGSRYVGGGTVLKKQRITAAGFFTEETVKKTGIADNTATAIITVTVLNAAQNAVIDLDIIGYLSAGTDASESTRTAKGSVVLSRTAGVDTVAAVSTLEGAQIATVAGGGTLTLAYDLGSISGASGATQTFTIRLTMVVTGTITSHAAIVNARVSSATAGVTIAAA